MCEAHPWAMHWWKLATWRNQQTKNFILISLHQHNIAVKTCVCCIMLTSLIIYLRIIVIESISIAQQSGPHNSQMVAFRYENPREFPLKRRLNSQKENTRVLGLITTFGEDPIFKGVQVCSQFHKCFCKIAEHFVNGAKLEF